MKVLDFLFIPYVLLLMFLLLKIRLYYIKIIELNIDKDNPERTIFSIFQLSYDYANIGFQELIIAMIPTNKILENTYITEKTRDLVEIRKKYCSLFQIMFLLGIIL